ncbi:hypothetical protein PHYBLDRAFT_105884 [Phycomyces blakesleeanus NRRL 1555(-)]|uniref:5-formyltetrahydrofolate cyclo-ligase n=1 Tax=Phycomyces blakesleeanus (strain ATCC 8743b / DSM 1359 / FGSC 10004 / NBRC 33097 / NRRL 1555) TaxID=763407 RepID=A0A167QBN0_PHYB8|nr:hypothetical protein PHYBLDRAFT_105884 [Phycomyces blakesleeanus NRRL 1555(-)]OAD79429.1 hypothetical protein PHYBLDRAFT_105884 [Phycomyces blakesleeanus NRRL 1555(-)]|eukprot:XP_018297469.1 hypothetical protein PHYBLDRAFT_105884 [Phycomyces blakesleeanus NRRL 1555(-)]
MNSAEAVHQHLFNLDAYKKSRHISVYISMPGSEIDTYPIIHSILRAGEKELYVPRCSRDSMEMVKIKNMEEFLSLPINKWNIPEPLHTTILENALDTNGLDLIIVPGLAFDNSRNRIGHGKGYYDRYIEKCNEWAERTKNASPTTVALALNEQIIETGRIPLEHTDKKVDCIITPQGII